MRSRQGDSLPFLCAPSSDPLSYNITPQKRETTFLQSLTSSIVSFVYLSNRLLSTLDYTPIEIYLPIAILP